MIQSQAQMAAAIAQNFAAFADCIHGLSEARFTLAPAGKWGAGQHLEHLLRSTRPVYMAIGLPGFVLRLLFGKPNRMGRSYHEVVDRYKAKLAAGGAASGRFVPPPVPYAQQAAKLRAFVQLGQRLQQRVARLGDKKLDGYLLPHPLLGKLTLREMIYFTIYHTQHHQQLVQQQTGPTAQ
jgi:hypothetical protein